MIEVSPTDRVLLLSVPSEQEVRTLASRLTSGLLVVVTERDDVYDLRRALVNHPNVMVTPADEDGALPWKDAFFSVVYATHVAEPSADMLRVLDTAGTIHLAGGSVTKR